jgi:hypothetical protein
MSVDLSPFPIRTDGNSVWNLGSTIPVKFRVCDARLIIARASVSLAFRSVAAAALLAAVKQPAYFPVVTFHRVEPVKDVGFDLAVQTVLTVPPAI